MMYLRQRQILLSQSMNPKEKAIFLEKFPRSKRTLAGEDGSKGRTDCQCPKETVLPRGEEGWTPDGNSGWAATQPET